MAGTAANSIPSQKGNTTTDGGKKSQPQGGLPTPETTPEPDVARTEADKARREKEVEDEIKRIIGSNSDTIILGVEASSSENDRIRAWQKLGCKIHPDYCGYTDKGKSEKERLEYKIINKKAFNKLAKAAEELDVEDRWISQVNLWDGTKDLLAESLDDDGGSEASGDPDSEMNEDPIAEPPERVIQIYEQATPFVQKLAEDPNDSDANNGLMALNNEILGGNIAHNAQYDGQENMQVSQQQWEIPIAFFQQHYTMIQKALALVRANPNDEGARKQAETERDLIKLLVQRNHFPNAWMLTVELPAKTVTPPPPDRSSTSASINYPWPTLPTDDGLIVGVRERKIGGALVCIETNKGDRLIRRLESAADFGQAKVDEYMKMPGYKSLSNTNIKLYRKDEARLKNLHWVTMSVIQNKNTAKGKMDPPTYCCVELDSQLEILTLSNVCNALGRKNGRAAIERVCEDHGIPAPWNRLPQNTYHKSDRDGPKKPAAERWAEVDSLVAPAHGTFVNNPSNGGGLTDPRVDVMADKLDRLEKTVANLVGVFQKLAEGGRIESSMFVTS
ncbi:C2 domain-containing protein [Pochonia chlamydosporia 170]|uniref:C2 domain-containing protein n=1 Tax=Pochonia chlamydosporia 170 TaxID=1380566 RepID=A0A179F3P4_METCM|nr:C2 domain-containing protein [Pochonia chlamydosporia 170]OAQ59739.1 C2 domain-containing protein [Pochonia chlamydosporia 170]